MIDEHTLPAWRTALWDLLAAGVADGDHPCRTGVLATTGIDGAPQARWVVLRRADARLAEVEVHTDSASEKIAELTRDPRAALSFWSPGDAVQLRLTLTMQILRGDAVQDRWARIPPAGRMAYGGEPAPGTTIPAPEDHTPGIRRARFCALVGTITRVDMVHLGQDRHRRALFAGHDGFAGRWLAP
ncbi:pyridoxamine 5'-phosphate oxidase family protein [Oceaniglobus indicus]|uniref:pyridoxamine 5'-phosphate oxidase family protein n=1 Tax=Oceaniglobus indicus TaxID=2047749 RepID=UPI000C1A547A|nr:pyridoxamine 5'-phosphate oxidase family protein [Oceaniglobus indicus]